MKKIILTLAVLALSSTSSFAARGDAGEGNGGGSSRPKPELVTVEIKGPPEPYDYSCPEQVWVSASMSCGNQNNNRLEQFNDFSRACTYKAAGWQTVPKTCQGTHEPVVGTKQVWQCPSPYVYSEYRDKHEVTRTCNLKDSDRGNVGNR